MGRNPPSLKLRQQNHGPVNYRRDLKKEHKKSNANSQPKLVNFSIP